MWWINYLLLQLYWISIKLHKYEPTDYIDNNLQCRHGPFPCTFLAWNFKIVNTTKIQDTYETRACSCRFFFCFHSFILFFIFFNFIILFYFYFFYYFIFVVVGESKLCTSHFCIPLPPPPPRTVDIVDTAGLKYRCHQENMPVKYLPPYTPLLYNKTGVCRVMHIFLIFAPKHRLWVLVRGVSNVYPQSMF